MAANVQPNGQANGTSKEHQTYRILVLAGDHVGPEVMAEAVKVLEVVEEERPHISFQLTHEICGGKSMDERGTPITDDVLRIAKEEVDAVLFGSVGGPEWGHKYPNPESSLLRLRAHIGAFANIRPATFYSKSLIPMSPLKPEIATPVNFIVLRENCGGAYYGNKIEEEDYAMDPWGYSTAEIERVSRVAGALARNLGKDGLGLGNSPPATVWSADKANVLANSRLWRKVITRVFKEEFPDVELKHQLADSLSMIMMTDPQRFNGVIVTDNTFGDMLSDQAGGVVGTLGVLPSASLCAVPSPGQKINGIYEPVHGSAPDIAGQRKANPVAQILSAALLLRYSLSLNEEALLIEKAVAKVLDSKDIGGEEIRTGDLGGKATTTEVGQAICKVLRELLHGSGGGLAGKPQAIEKYAEKNKAYEEAAVHNAKTGPATSIATS